jgi:hypothetical protein
MEMKHLFTIILGALFIIGCKEAKQPVMPFPDISGDYADASYAKRSDGFDWVGVRVRKIADSTIQISVRSRSDLKKPTCTMDAMASKVNDSVYRAAAEGKPLRITFSENGLRLQAENDEDTGSFGYFCSGGATLEGSYTRIEGNLDPSQVDPRIFQQMLSWENTFYEIETRADGHWMVLIVTPYGLTIDNTPATVRFKGTVNKTEIVDLNGDSYPEILIFTQAPSAGKHGNMIGFSINNGKSMSRISFPDVRQDEQAREGFRGEDSFEIEDGLLVRYFPVYQRIDGQWRPTGTTRRLQYRFLDGEASREFVLTHISDNKTP